MDPITPISTVGSILGGGGIFAGINLLNGHLQRKFQEAENEKQREFQRQMQDRQNWVADKITHDMLYYST